MIRTLVFVIAILFSYIAQADGNEQQCFLEINSKVLLNWNSCTQDSNDPDVYAYHSKDNIFVYIIDNTAYWNEGDGTHAHSPLGNVKYDNGGCWVNKKVTLCVGN